MHRVDLGISGAPPVQKSGAHTGNTGLLIGLDQARAARLSVFRLVWGNAAQLPSLMQRSFPAGHSSAFRISPAPEGNSSSEVPLCVLWAHFL